VSLPGELEEPQYAEFEYLYKQGKIPLVEFLYRFQHLGSLDISQPRLGEYSPEKLCAIFGQSNSSGFDKKFLNDDLTDSHDINILEYNYEQDARFHLLYTNGGRFMLLREKAKSELLKILWALKRILIEFANRNRFGDLIFYLELNELFSLTAENRDVLRMQALQKKAYLDACQQHRVSKVLSDKYAPFEKKPSYKEQDNEHLYRFANGKSICHGHAEGICLTASNNDEFINKLTSYRAKNIENIIGVFKGIELSYFNVSALVGFTTENGGFLSHAATIAREYRLPYISGISIDQVLDGDYLILDTDNEQVIIRR
jgi:phosphohistidine swiveling domain-containing protein